MSIEEKIILKGLVKNSDYFLKVFPFIDDSLFESKVSKQLFKCLKLYYDKWNKQANIPVLQLYVEKVSGFTQDQFNEANSVIEFISNNDEINTDWLQHETLEWIKKRKFYNAILDGASEFEKGNLDTRLSDKLNDALSVSFDEEIGMSLEETEKRWNLYNTKEDHIPFNIETLNTITSGGITKKTLNILLSSDTGGFKSGSMCSFTSDYIRQGKTVVYFTFEMSEEKILERIDANLLNTNIDDIPNLGKDVFMTRIDEIRNKTNGKLIVKQFPTSQCHCGHLRHFLRELYLKRRIKPDIIMADYLNIMASSRIKHTEAGNSYGYIKAISEELRGLAIEFDVPIWSATQSNRGGSENENLKLTDISESYALVYVADLALGIVSTPDFDKQNKLLWIQLKNRYKDKNNLNKFFLGVDKPKMKLFDVQNTLTTTGTGEADKMEMDNFQALTGFKKRREITL